VSFCSKTKSLILLVSLVAIGTIIGCGGTERDEVPITTTSAEARQHYIEGRGLQERLRYDAAMESFEKALNADPDFALAHLRVAMAAPDSRYMFEHLNAALRQKDKVSEGEQLLIEVFEMVTSGDTEGQRLVLEELIEMYPKDVRVHADLANLYYGTQQYEKAIELYDLIRSLDPDYSGAYNMAGYTYRALGELDKAEDAFRQYIEMIPDDPNPYDSYAELLLKQGQFDSSLAYYSRAITVDSSFYPSYGGVATNLVLLGDYEAAKETIRKLLNPPAHNRRTRVGLGALAVIHADEGDLDGAIETVKKRMILAELAGDVPAQISDLYLIGNLQLFAERAEEAVEAYKKAQKMAKKSDLPDDVKGRSSRNYLFAMARAALVRKDVATARAHFDSYREKSKGSNNLGEIRGIHLLAGIIALHEKDYDKAVHELSQSDGESAFVSFRIAKALQGRGDLEAAREQYLKVASFNAPSSLEFALLRHQATELARALDIP